MLNENHYRMLTEGSGISDEVIRARGYRTIREDPELRALGFAPAQCRAPGLLLPLWTTDGGSADGGNGHYIYRPDNPRVYDDKSRKVLPDGTYHQRVIKYEMPKGEGVRVDCPPTCRPQLADPSVPLFITEGQKKADALASRGACAIALLGVWNFKGRNDFGGTTLLADFDYIALENRTVYLVFDSDVMSKSGVRAALERLTEHLKRKRAAVHVIYLPRLDNGKTGVDDWLVATGKGLAELVALAEGPRPEIKAAPPRIELLDDTPPSMTMPLALIDGRAYVATWGSVRVTEDEKENNKGVVVRFDKPRVSNETRLFVVRDDGVIFGEGGDRPAGDLGIDLVLPEVLQAEERLSIPALKSYRSGYRPDPADVFRRVCECVDHFIDFDRSLGDQRTMVEMIACYTMATWFLPAFTVAGFLWPNGDRGSGKTQLLSVITQMAYLGKVVLGGGSFAALRDLADYGATLAFDDAENFSDPRKTDPDKRALLLAGNRRGNTVPMKERVVDGWKTRYVNTFSFRLFSATQLPDPILASRTIVVPLIRSIDRNRTNISTEDQMVWPHDRKKLVDDLWLLSLAHMPKMRGYEAAINAESSLTGRNLEPWRALLAVAAWLDGEKGGKGERGMGGSPRLPGSPSPLLSRMMALSVAYQQERPNVEAADMTRLVIMALGMIIGKKVKDISDVCDVCDTSDVYRLSHFLLTALITQAAQLLLNHFELDINPETVTSRRVGNVLRRMRFITARQGTTGKRGWNVSVRDVHRWSVRYGLDPSSIMGLKIVTHSTNVTDVTNVTNVTTSTQSSLFQGVL